MSEEEEPTISMRLSEWLVTNHKLKVARQALVRIRAAGGGNYESNLAGEALEEMQNVES